MNLFMFQRRKFTCSSFQGTFPVALHPQVFPVVFGTLSSEMLKFSPVSGTLVPSCSAVMQSCNHATSDAHCWILIMVFSCFLLQETSLTNKQVWTRFSVICANSVRGPWKRIICVCWTSHPV